MSIGSGINLSNISGGAGGGDYVSKVASSTTTQPVKENYEVINSTMSGGIEEKLINAIEKANRIQSGTTECEFSVHQGTKQIMIKLVDTTTKQVIKEIPSEKILDMVAKMCDLAGLFIDEKR